MLGGRRAVAFSIHICALVLATAALYFARDIFLPIVLGLLITLTVLPIVRWLGRRGVPPTLSAFAIVISMALVLGLAALALSDPITRWLAEAPMLGQQLEEKLRGLRNSIQAISDAGERIEAVSEVAEDSSEREVVLKEPGFLSDATTSMWTGATTVSISLLLVLFLLASGDMLYIKIIRVLPTLTDRKTAIRIVHDIEAAISRYLLTVALINIGLGVAVGMAMWGRSSGSG